MVTCVCYGNVSVERRMNHIVFLREISLVPLWCGLIDRYLTSYHKIPADPGHFITQDVTDAI